MLDVFPLAWEVYDDTPSQELSLSDLRVGQNVSQRVLFDQRLLDYFEGLAKDRAPLHSNASAAQSMGFSEPIVQGLAVTSRFSRLIGMYLPGSRAVLQKIEMSYHQPVYLRQTLLYNCSVTRILLPLKLVQLSLSVSSGDLLHASGKCQCILR